MEKQTYTVWGNGGYYTTVEADGPKHAVQAALKAQDWEPVDIDALGPSVLADITGVQLCEDKTYTEEERATERQLKRICIELSSSTSNRLISAISNMEVDPFEAFTELIEHMEELRAALLLVPDKVPA